MAKTYQDELKALGSRIRQIRKHRTLKLLDLESLTDINDSKISKYERGLENIEFHTIFRLAQALGVTLKDLFDYDGPLPDNTHFRKPPRKKA